MRIACLQFAPQVGDVDNNLNRADAVLSKANPQNLDLLVLPELAFSGYNFKSLQQISPYLEPTTSGITSLWARTTALKYECVVTVGYPEKVDITPKWPASPEYYNSAITVNADGETIANYRKSFLYYTDETWALEGPDGFFDGEIEGLGNVAMGICMDLNPYKFEAPWSAWEFAYHILHKEANLVILSMAWLTRENARSYSRCPKDPDMDTLSYWLARLEPLIRAETEGELICVFANRSGTEEEAVYAGTSAVLGIHAGEVKVYGILGRGEKELLVVDTNKRPQAKLVSEPNSTASDVKDDQGDIKGDRKDVKPSEKVGKVEKAEKDEKVEKAEKAEKAENIEKPEKAEEAEKAEKPEKAERNTTAEYNADSSAEASTDERTNSTVSDMSDLSVNTQVTACTTPDFPNVCFPKSMEDVVTPLSPVDANSPSAFFAPRSRRPDGDTLRESLKSSIGQQDFQAAKPDSPTFVRPASPKSRNASRTRQLEYQEPALRTHDLASEEQVTRKGSPGVFRPPSPKSRNASRTRQPEYQEPALRTHDLAQEEQVTRKGSPVIFGPPSPKSRNASRTRQPEYQELALASHDLAKEEQITYRSIGIQSPVQPHSAAAALDRYNPSFSPTHFSSRRSISLSPRPKSTVW